MGLRNILLLICTVLLLTNSLKLGEQHFLNTSEQQDLAYYEALTQRETDLKTGLAQVKENLKYIHKTLSQLEGLPDQQILAL